MPSEETLTAKPYAVHVPDEYTDTEKEQGASWPLGAGFLEVGFEVNGARFPLARIKGGAAQKQFDLAAAAKGTGSTPSADK